MLVDAVQMRKEGRKLPTDEVMSAIPVRGVLSVDTYTSTRAGDRGTTYAALTNGKGSEPLLAALRNARVTKLKGEDFVIHGTETHVPKIGSSSSWPQAWWCRRVESATI